MENDTTPLRQRKYKSSLPSKGLKRVGVVVPIENAGAIKATAKKLRDDFKLKKGK